MGLFWNDQPEIHLASSAIALIGVAICIVWVLQLAGSNWFQFHSAPDQALLAPIQRRDDVAGHFRLLGQDPLPTTIYAGESLTVVPYWRALRTMDENYAAVLRLDEVGSQRTLAEIEQSHPSDIPTSSWATGLYLRDSFEMHVPADALPIQYAIGAGFRDPATGDMLPTENGTTVELGRLWVLSQDEPDPPAGPRVRFGPTIEFLGAHTDPTQLTLYWRTDRVIAGDYSIFIHVLDTQGQVVGQMDGTPYDNRYPLWAWQPGQIIEDQRNLATIQVDPEEVDAVAVGVYDLDTGERLAALDTNGNALPNNAQIIPW